VCIHTYAYIHVHTHTIYEHVHTHTYTHTHTPLKSRETGKYTHMRRRMHVTVEVTRDGKVHTHEEEDACHR
jgi:hypothetical protein